GKPGLAWWKRLHEHQEQQWCAQRKLGNCKFRSATPVSYPASSSASVLPRIVGAGPVVPSRLRSKIEAVPSSESSGCADPQQLQNGFLPLPVLVSRHAPKWYSSNTTRSQFTK